MNHCRYDIRGCCSILQQPLYGYLDLADYVIV